MNASTPVLSTKLKVFRWIMALAGMLDGVLSFGLVIAGIWIVRMSATGMESADHREEFAVGMIVGGLAWVAWLAAAILAGLAFACWRVYLKVGRSGQWRLIDILTLLLALIAASVGIATCLGRLSNGE
jgi:hypothetical protein